MGVGLLHATRIFHRPYSALFNKTFCRRQQLNEESSCQIRHIAQVSIHVTSLAPASGASCGANVQK